MRRSLVEAVREKQQAAEKSGIKPAAPARPQLSPELFDKFSDLIYQLSGLKFASGKAYFISSKLDRRCQELGLSSFQEYYDYLMKPVHQAAEYPKLVDAVTINETFFFRNQQQISTFEQEILIPMLRKRRREGQMKLRIWSCAASTGDEAYTLALQLLSLPEAKGFYFEVVGTDICREAIDKGKAGVYRQYNIRNIPQDLRQRYFDEGPGKTFTISDEVKKHVTLKYGNLMDKARVGLLGRFDIAFCRNVLIYFDVAGKETALSHIYSALKDDGVLVSGHSENLYAFRHLFQSIKEHPEAHAYTKAPPGTEKSRF